MPVTAHAHFIQRTRNAARGRGSIEANGAGEGGKYVEIMECRGTAHRACYSVLHDESLGWGVQSCTRE
jgi:hypothetical protein